MKHDFKNLGSLQWGKLGLPYDSARTDYKCKICGKGFTHFYHQEPSIYKAIENAGLTIDTCQGQELLK